MGTKRTARIALAVLGAGALLLGACASDDRAEAPAPGAADPAAGSTGTTTGGDGHGGDTAAEGGFGQDGADGGAVLTALGQTSDAGRSIVRTVTLGIEVEDPAAAVDAITAATRRAGGFVAEADLQRADTRDGDGVLQGSMTLRVPVDRLDATLATLTELSVSAPETTISTEDVTGQLVDLEARLVNLRALEAELRSFLSEARQSAGATPEAVLTVFDRVNQVRSDIERLEAQRSNLSDLVSLATVRVELRPAAGAGAVVPSGWSATRVLRSAAHTTMVALQGVANVAIWLVAFVLPVAAVLGLPAGAVWWAVRRRRPDTPAT